MRYYYLISLVFCIACTPSPREESQQQINQCDTITVYQLPLKTQALVEALPPSLILSYSSKEAQYLDSLQLRKLHAWLDSFRKHPTIKDLPDPYVHQQVVIRLQSTGLNESYLTTCTERMKNAETIIHSILGSSNGNLPLYQTIKRITWGSDSADTIIVSIHVLH